MAKVSREAIHILAKRVSDKIDGKKELVIPTKIAKLIAEYTSISDEVQKLNNKLTSLSNQLSTLGYSQKGKNVDNSFVYVWLPKQIPVSTYNQIHDDIVLALEFDKKDLASLEKELVAKYS
jgi:secreted protein with Ig-like and vWFA domain